MNNFKPEQKLLIAYLDYDQVTTISSEYYKN